ncbi:MAG: hypothetical protein KIT43_13280 [Bauldia sp.]|nr:hypothetical protein [Bauldia sp.]MCW5717008.1 hypothetical protein [Bauldia sp.]
MNLERARQNTLIRGGLLVVLACSLAGCGTTYGTGVGTTAQTFQDMTNVLNLRQPEGINYQPLPGVVVPPCVNDPTPCPLPPPTTGTP